MTSNSSGRNRILGSLRSVDGKGAIRIEDRYDSGIDELWSAITDRSRLARWYGQVDGDLRLGGKFDLFIESDGWRGTGRVEVCEPPTRLRVMTRESDESYLAGRGAPPFEDVIDATLTGDGDQTVLVIEIQGVPLDKVEFFGAGWQIHAENLATYVAGRERGDTEARWDELIPPYRDQADSIR